MTRAMASITPVTMPDRAVGRTILTIVFHFGIPRAYDASRRSCGTIFNISSVARTTSGTISNTSAIATTNPERGNPRVVRHTA